MRLKTALLILCIVVVNACSPQVTVTSEVTVTSTPPPTETPIPTPTLHPQVIELQATLASSGERYTLDTSTGYIYDGAETVPGLTVAPDGTMTLTVNGETVTLDPADVNFDDENGISIEGYDWDGNEWVEAEPKLENGVGEPELREDGRYYQSNSDGVEYMLAGDEWVRTFPECSFGEYKSCPVEIGDIPAMQDYVRALVTPEMFNLDNLKYLKMNELKLPFGSVLIPSAETAPNYEGADAQRAPFIKDTNWNGVTVVDGVENHAVVNIPYVVKDGNGGHKVIVMSGLRAMKGGGYDAVAKDYFDNRMNVIPWRIDQESIELATRFVNPATGKNFTYGEVKTIIEEMRQGNFANADGLVFYFDIARVSGGLYE